MGVSSTLPYMVDISRSNAIVGIFLVGGALLGVGLGFVALNYDNDKNNKPSDEPDKVTAEDVIVTPETNEQGEQTGVVKINNTADKKIVTVSVTPRRKRILDANTTASYNSNEFPLFDIYNLQGEKLYTIKSEDSNNNTVVIERHSTSD